MPRNPRLTAGDAEALLSKAGFVWLRSKGSHRIYSNGVRRVVVPSHGNDTLHPKIVKQLLEAIDDVSIPPDTPI